MHMKALGGFSPYLIIVSFRFPLCILWGFQRPQTHLLLPKKADLVLKVNPTQQDWRMALFLGRKYVGSGQTAVRTFSSGNRALNTHRWCTYMVYWLPTSVPICSNGMMPTHKLAGSLPLVCRCQAMMGLDGQPA